MIFPPLLNHQNLPYLNKYDTQTQLIKGLMFKGLDRFKSIYYISVILSEE
jgi:hypothetical protein